jgi:hypothetical protein
LKTYHIQIRLQDRSSLSGSITLHFEIREMGEGFQVFFGRESPDGEHGVQAQS